MAARFTDAAAALGFVWQFASSLLAGRPTDHAGRFSTATGSVQEYRHAVAQLWRANIRRKSTKGFLLVFECGINGIYQHCAEKHLHRYLAEFDFRHNHRVALGVNDTMRAEVALLGVIGKRLTYRTAR